MERGSLCRIAHGRHVHVGGVLMGGRGRLGVTGHPHQQGAGEAEASSFRTAGQVDSGGDQREQGQQPPLTLRPGDRWEP